MRDALIMLRQENSHLSMEIIELKGDISLRDDQVRILNNYHSILCYLFLSFRSPL
jgi:hypothetical protein